MPSSIEKRHDGRVGIIDIGSNSMRFVVYDQLKRAPVPLYNEKVMCQLGKGLASSGKLNAEGADMAKAAMGRFLALARNMEVRSFYVMATAAVRDAKDGEAFARALEKEYGVEVDIISGEHEAKLGAYGITASIHEPHGITGDLGGGSMELVNLNGAHHLAQVTLPVGPLRLIDETKGKRDEMRDIITRQFDRVKWLVEAKPKHFYAIGGSFRAIARLHMALENYPLRILHQYTVGTKSFLDFAHELAMMSDEKLEKLPGLSGKRVPAIPPAVMILERIIETAGPEKIVFSASGIREGYLFEKLPQQLRGEDVLISGCMEVAEKGGGNPAYARELMGWTAPLFDKEPEDEQRLRLAFCLLSDIAHHIHPEYRAEWAMQRILFSSFTGLTHRERAQLALALYHRYQFKLGKDAPGAVKALPDRAKAWAKLAGVSANLAYHLSGSIPGSLHTTSLKAGKHKIALYLSPPAEALMGEAIARRIAGVEEAYQEWVK